MDNDIIANFSHNTDDDSERKLVLTIDDERELTLSPHNTTVVSYFGNLAQYNHIHYITDDEFSDYIFEQAIPEDYKGIVKLARKFEYTEYRNVRKVAKAVFKAFDRAMFYDIEAALSIPEGWS